MIVRRPAFIDALIENATYIGQDSPAAAERFLAAAEATILQLQQTPRLGRIYESENPRLAGIRVIHIKAFRNYLLFYRLIPAGIELLHLLHGARDIPSVLSKEL